MLQSFLTLTDFRIIDMPLTLPEERTEMPLSPANYVKKTIETYEAKIGQCKKNIVKREDERLDDVDVKNLKSAHEAEAQAMRNRHTRAMSTLTNAKDAELRAATATWETEIETAKNKIGFFNKALPILKDADAVDGMENGGSPVRNSAGPSRQASRYHCVSSMLPRSCADLL